MESPDYLFEYPNHDLYSPQSIVLCWKVSPNLGGASVSAEAVAQFSISEGFQICLSKKWIVMSLGYFRALQFPVKFYYFPKVYCLGPPPICLQYN